MFAEWVNEDERMNLTQKAHGLTARLSTVLGLRLRPSGASQRGERRGPLSCRPGVQAVPRITADLGH